MIYRVDIQTGAWHILASDGYSVFMIYPYFPQRGAPQSVYQGIVLKVNGTLTEYDLRAAIRKRTPTVKIDSYDVFGANGVSVKGTRDHTSWARFRAGVASGIDVNQSN